MAAQPGAIRPIGEKVTPVLRPGCVPFSEMPILAETGRIGVYPLRVEGFGGDQ